jgi:multiple sugar transport system permease protein
MAFALPAKRAPMGRLRRQEARAGLLFVLPWLIFLLVFTAYPVLGTVFLSFTEYAIVDSPTWVGLDNYERMFTADPAFWTAVKNSAYYAAFSVPLRLVLALALALLLNLGVRGISIYRVIFYLPALVPPVAATIVFMLMFNFDAGPINGVMSAVGLSPPDWLRDPAWSKPALIILSLWPLGVETLVFLAGLKEIPQDMLDAAAVDGASPFRRLVGVVLPLLTPVILFNLVIGVIYSFQVFGQALVIGDTTGRPLESTLMYMVHIYRSAFRYFAMGYAAALAVVLFLAVVVLTFVIFRSARLWVHYEGGDR